MLRTESSGWAQTATQPRTRRRQTGPGAENVDSCIPAFLLLGLGLQMGDLRVLLRPDRQLRRQKALSLVLRGVRTVYNVGHELRPERQRQVATVDVTSFLLVNDEQVVTGLLDRNIDVLAQLDVPLRPEHEQPSVAPRSEPVWSKP